MCEKIIVLRHTVFECYPICLSTPFLGHPVFELSSSAHAYRVDSIKNKRENPIHDDGPLLMSSLCCVFRALV